MYPLPNIPLAVPHPLLVSSFGKFGQAHLEFVIWAGNALLFFIEEALLTSQLQLSLVSIEIMCVVMAIIITLTFNAI